MAVDGKQTGGRHYLREAHALGKPLQRRLTSKEGDG